MKRRIILFFKINFLLSFAFSAFTQDFGEKWIVPNQKYYKIKTAEDAIYHISYQDLLNVGFPVGTPGFNKRKIQIFHRGVEQAIFIPGALDGALGAAEYVEFYGKRNDGTVDALLYSTPDKQPHKYYNLYSDTTAFFLTYAFGNVSGKRMEVKSAEFNSSGLPKEAYHLDEKLLIYKDNYSEGQYYPIGSNSVTLLSAFDTGEGWTGTSITKATSKNFTISDITNVVPSGPQPILEVLLVGRNNRKHNIRLLAGNSTSNFRTIKDLEFNYYDKGQIAESINFTDISGAGKVETQVQVNGFADGNTDYASVSYIKLTYPQSFNLSGATRKVFNIQPNGGGKSYVEITGANASTIIYDITDLNNLKRLNYFLTGSTAATVVSGTQSGRKLFVVNNDFKVAKPQGISFRNLSTIAKYLIVSHSFLRQSVGGISDPVREYATYRASAAGGSFDTLTVDIDQLYNQFTYGEISALAIRRFADYMLTYGSPEYLFILGKGLKITQSYYRNVPSTAPENNTVLHKDLIPPAGFPGSDVPFTAGLKGSGFEPAIPTGRIAARTPQEVISYLNKVKEMESAGYKDLSRKKLIHLSGGLQPNEVLLFKAYVNDFENIAVNEYLGGDVTTISKTSNLNVEFINIAQQVNNGAGMVTFFGHSAANVTDIEIGLCSNPVNGYTNKGKYPMFYVNGCDAGDVFNASYSMGEDWTLTADKGAIAFFAYSDLAYAGPLKRFADTFYNTAFADSIYINKSIGQIHKETIKRFLTQYSPSELYQSQAQMMLLQGDPAYSIFKPVKTDYETNDDQVYVHSYDGKPITALTDSFAIGVVAKNFGKALKDSLLIQVKRTLSSGSEIIYDSLVSAIYYMDTVFINIKSKDDATFGPNRFEIYLDPLDSIKELNEMNNIGRIEYYIPLTGVATVTPYEFSIINTPEVTLMAQTTQVVQGPLQYIFEIDTSYLFTSPWKKQQIISSETLPSWKVNVGQLSDTTVYYWRAKFNNSEPTNLWANSSFTYIKNGPEGWTQSAFPQLLNDEAVNIVKNTAQRKLEFLKVTSNIKVKTYGHNYSPPSYTHSTLSLNDFTHVFEGRCGDNMLIAVAFNKVTAEPYLVFNKINYGSSFYCGRIFNEIANRFTDANISALRLEEYINKVSTGDYVVLFSSGKVNFESWPATTKNMLKFLGIDLTEFNKLKNGHPYIAFGKKDAAIGTAIQMLPNLTPPNDPYIQELEFIHTVTGQHNKGTLTTDRIGPSSGWSKLYKKSILKETSDSLSVDVIGVDAANAEYTLATQLKIDSLDLSFINEKQYPYLKLKAYIKDTVNLTPAKLVRWQVNYLGVPEGIAYLKPGQKLDSLQFEEGTEFEINYIFKNITGRDFTDSLTVQQLFLNNTTLKRSVVNQKYAPLNKYDSLAFKLKINTLDRVGVNSIQTYVNPKIQLEQNYYNNVVALNRFYTVNKDNTNPILDVVFDGVHIMDGDIVAPSPLINISLKDDSKYRLKKDTAGVEVYVKHPCEICPFERISFSDPKLKWMPADESNKFRIEYQPDNLVNGKHSLLVQGTDEAGNKSGVQPYQVNFEVINESTITNFYPYPNPFSTKTRFVFTLTGREVPDEIKVLVMTISGKVVREINQDELGPIKIGNNISEFYWDGTDQFGDKLANGVYLYKVTVKKNGIALDHRQSGGDKGFHKGFGKMYILR